MIDVRNSDTLERDICKAAEDLSIAFCMPMSIAKERIKRAIFVYKDWTTSEENTKETLQ